MSMTPASATTEQLLDGYRKVQRYLRARTAALLAATVEIYEGRNDDVGTLGASFAVLSGLLERHHRTEAEHLFPLLAARSADFAAEQETLATAHARLQHTIAAVEAALAAAVERPSQWNVLARVVSDAAALHDEFDASIERSWTAVCHAAPDAITPNDTAALIARIRRSERPSAAVPFALAAGTTELGELPLMVRMLAKYCWSPRFSDSLAPLHRPHTQQPPAAERRLEPAC